MKVNDSDEFLKFRLRLFLSVDIVGSTAFKQGRAITLEGGTKSKAQQTIPAEPWFSPIAKFYREVERIFSREWEFYCDNFAKPQGWPTGPAPELWKGAGDELIYTKELEDHKEALGCLHVWMKTLTTYRSSFTQEFPSLDLKSSAWVAGFPVTNAEIILRSSVGSHSEATDDDDAVFTNLDLLKQYYDGSGSEKLIRDYIGPSIDTGFRLSGLATPRKLVVSIDLALMLVVASRIQPNDFGYPEIKFYYDGRVGLKGVFGGNPYPIFWLDMLPGEELNVAEDALSSRNPLDSDSVKKFCEVFISKNSKYVIVPYIQDNPEKFFSCIPPAHESRMEHLKRFWEEESKKRKDEADSYIMVDEKDAAQPFQGNIEQASEEFMQKLADDLESGSKAC